MKYPDRCLNASSFWQLSSTSVAENSDIGASVGTFDTIDVDDGQKDNYRLVNSANGMFRINGSILEVSFLLFGIHN